MRRPGPFAGRGGCRARRRGCSGRRCRRRRKPLIDASGLIVAPGFVDLHTHYDAQIQWDPYCTISGWHGVTSVVLGNCGFGFAPVRSDERDRAMPTMSRTEAIPFETMKRDHEGGHALGLGHLSGVDPDIEPHPDGRTIPGVSAGGAHTKVLTAGSYTTDLLTWLVRDEQRLSLEQAHYRLSYLPAHAAGFKDRGVLHEDAPADIVVYDLENLKRTAEWVGEVVHDPPAGEWRRVQRAEGYRWILVNGEVTFEDGECTGATPGKLLRHGRG